MNFFIQLTLICLMVSMIKCFPGGAPASRCEDLFPAHSSPAMKGESPFFFDAVKNGSSYKVTILSKTNKPFRGFILQARKQIGDPRTIFGTWKLLDKHTKLLNCVGKANSGVTHTWADDGNRNTFKSVSFLWTPSETVSNFVFTGTVVERFSLIWEKIVDLQLL